jgi:hypothetical protein
LNPDAQGVQASAQSWASLARYSDRTTCSMAGLSRGVGAAACETAGVVARATATRTGAQPVHRANGTRGTLELSSPGEPQVGPWIHWKFQNRLSRPRRKTPPRGLLLKGRREAAFVVSGSRSLSGFRRLVASGR